MNARLRLVWTGLVVLGLGFAALDVVALVPRRSGVSSLPVVCPTRRIADPVEVATRFLATAVERHDLAASYALAAPSLRGARSCDDWSRGHVPIAAFRHIDWSRASYQNVAGGEGQVVLRVLLYRPGAPDPVAFLMEIQTESSEPGWHVGWFGHDRWYRGLAPSPAA
jgi:hypothetical protein